MTFDLDRAIRGVLEEIVATAPEPHPEPTREVQVARGSRPRRPSRTVTIVAAAAAVIVTVVVVAAVTRRSGSSPATPVLTAPPPTVPAIGAPAVTLAVDAVEPAPDEWSRLPDLPLAARSEQLLVATDDGVLVWGGWDTTGPLADGAYLDVSSGAWRPLPEAPLAADRGDAIGVWTGTEVVVINGVQGYVRAAAFDPATFTWRALDAPPVDHAANATGRALYVDGTVALWSTDEDNDRVTNTLVLLDIASGSWTTASTPPVSVVSGGALVGDVDQLYVVGRHDHPTGCWELTALRYTRASDTWTELDTGPVSNHSEVVVAWTGSELFVAGGAACVDGFNDGTLTSSGYLLDPVTGAWRPTSPAPAGLVSSYRYPDPWTGTAVVTFDAEGRPMIYDPASDRWHVGPAPDPERQIAVNQTPVVVLDGALIVVDGAYRSGDDVFRDPFTGAYRYTIPSAGG